MYVCFDEIGRHPTMTGCYLSVTSTAYICMYMHRRYSSSGCKELALTTDQRIQALVIGREIRGERNGGCAGFFLCYEVIVMSPLFHTHLPQSP
jgi:hypothetical protein